MSCENIQCLKSISFGLKKTTTFFHLYIYMSWHLCSKFLLVFDIETLTCAQNTDVFSLFLYKYFLRTYVYNYNI